MAQVPIRDIDLKNQEFIDILNEYKDVLLKRENKDDTPFIAKKMPVSDKDKKPEDWVSNEYMHEIIAQGRSHEGFPKVLKGHTGLKYQDTNYKGGDDIKVATRNLNSKLIEFLSCRNNALNACYPPGGFISWHNNANAPGYNIIITYSETGDGWFDYWDIEKKERVRIQDKPGWQAKMTYFGPYGDPEKLCYHAAYTDCYRITVAFVFAEADEFWEEVIADLETPC